MTDERRPRAPAMEPAKPKSRRPSKRLLRAGAWIAGGMAFALPWAAVAGSPRPAAVAPASGQVLVIPTATKVIYRPANKGAGATVIPAGTATGNPVTTTGGTAPP